MSSDCLIIFFKNHICLFVCIGTADKNSFSSTGTVQVIDIAAPQPSTLHNITVYATSLTSGLQQPFALVVTGSVTALNVTNSYSNSVRAAGSVAMSSLTINLIIGLSIASSLLLFTLCWIYRNQRKVRNDLHLEAFQRRRSSLLSHSNNNSPNRSRSNSDASRSSIGNSNSRPR